MLHCRLELMMRHILLMLHFFDYDQDGDLDLFVLNHSDMFINSINTVSNFLDNLNEMEIEELRLHSSRMYRNDGGMKFTEVTEESKIGRPGFGLGLATADFNHDGLIDIFVANDYFIPDFLYINKGDGTFVESIKHMTNHISFFSMGCDAADFNNDGLMDIAVVDMTSEDHIKSKVSMAPMNVEYANFLTDVMKFQPQYMFNAMHMNIGNGRFSEIALMSGVAKTDWSWAPLFADFNNDGLKDYFVSNGFRRDTKDNDWAMKYDSIAKSIGGTMTESRYWDLLQMAKENKVVNYIFENTGNQTFVKKTVDWGFEVPSFSNGSAYGDLDNDGDLDLVVNNIEDEAFLYRNNSTQKNGNHFLRVQPIDNKGKSSSFHAKVTLVQGDKIQYIEINPSRGYQSSVEPVAHFGLGSNEVIDQVIIDWLDGNQSVIKKPGADQTLVINKSRSITGKTIRRRTAPIFADVTSQRKNLTFTHTENEFNDFAKEVLLPHRQSRLGPNIAVGDVNGDGLDDFFAGGAKGQGGVLYIQNQQAKFETGITSPWDKNASSEDMGALFFDADQDGDLDLYVASGGGGDFAPTDKALQDHLYINDGNGNFKDRTGNLPSMITSSSRVRVADFDKDGDADLIVGGRGIPGKYPYPANSYLLQNDNGTFTDITQSSVPDFRELGLVTDLQWVDYDGDGDLDIAVVGEWMAVNIFNNDGGKFKNVTVEMGLDKAVGWYQSIAIGDFDNDGDTDLIAGNIGKNNKFKASEKKPLHVYCNDFDNNGTTDIVLSSFYKGNKVPVRGKECSTAQMPFIKDKFPAFTDFAHATLEDIYTPEKLENSLHYEARNFNSIILINEGGQYIIRELPIEVQASPINGIVVKDFNRDGNLDMVVAGNNMTSEVETPLYDAGKGYLLLGDGKGGFRTTINSEEDGLLAVNDVKDVQYLELGPTNNPAILIANNNGRLQLYAYMN